MYDCRSFFFLNRHRHNMLFIVPPHNSQRIDDKTDTTNITTTTTTTHTSHTPHTPHRTTPHGTTQHHTAHSTRHTHTRHVPTHTNTHQQTHHTSCRTSFAFLRIHDKLLICFWRRAFATPRPLPSSLPLFLLLSPSFLPSNTPHTPTHFRNIAICDPATHLNATEHISVSSVGTSPLYFKWHEVCT